MIHRFGPLLAIPLLFACTEKLVPLEELTSTTLSAQGGKAKSAAGELELTFPAGALPGATTVHIRTQRGAHPLAGSHGLAIYELNTDPPVGNFSTPIELVLDVSRAKSDRYVIANFDGAAPAPLTSTRLSPTRIRAELTHFSRYGAWVASSSTACPANFPEGSDTCSIEGLRCEYGQECCCGQCYPALVATCSQGSWARLNTDACLGAAITCPDSGPSPDAGGCAGTLDCLDGCGGDILTRAECVEGELRCPANTIPYPEVDILCAGQHGGPCVRTSTPACQGILACGNDGRCYPPCFGGNSNHEGRCRREGAIPGCCTDEAVDGLCGVLDGLFSVCPEGSIELSVCTASTSGSCGG